MSALAPAHARPARAHASDGRRPRRRRRSRALPRGGDRGARARGLSPDEARRAARLELGNVDRRPRAGARLWLGEPRRHARSPTCATARAGCAAAPASPRSASSRWRSASAPAPRSSAPSTRSCSSRCRIRRPSAIVTIWDVGRDGRPLDVTFGTYRELVERSRTFDALAVMRPWQPTLTGAAEPERLDGQRVSANYFRVLGVRPALGRDFRPSDDRAQRSRRRDPERRALAPALRRRSARSSDARSCSTTTATRVIGVMPPASRTSSRPRPTSGRRCNTTRRCRPMAANGATTCAWSAGCEPASA